MTSSHDRDVLRAIKAQARNGREPITGYQIQHVYQIGRRSAWDELEPRLLAALDALAELHDNRDLHDYEDCSPGDTVDRTYECGACKILREYQERADSQESTT